MIEQKRIGSLTNLTATDGYVHKTGTETYAKQMIMLPGDSIGMYEEVSEIPPYTREEYRAKVAELIRERYSESKEFEIQREMINAICSPQPLGSESSGHAKAVENYAEYNSFVEQCKLNAPAAIEEQKRNDQTMYDSAIS